MRFNKLSIVAVTYLAACGPKRLPQQPAPPPVMPAVELAAIPPEAGTGRVVLDAVDGPVAVIEILASESYFGSTTVGTTTALSFAHGESTRTVCVTPCVANLRYGSRSLKFVSRSDPERMSSFDIQVTTHPTVHRINPGRLKTSNGRFIGGAVLSVLAGSAAVSLITVGGLSGNDTALGIGVASAGLTLVGGLLYNSGRSEITPGAITSFPVAPAQ